VPSPLGHALGGIAAGWGSAPRRGIATAAILSAVAIAPDLDLVAGDHRGISHSVGAAVIAGVVAATLWSAFAAPPLRRDTLRVALSATLAWGSHILLDWLSNDTRPPLGVMALWPFTRDYYKAGIEIFPPVSRRYWETRFWIYNLKALAFELAVIGPLTALIVRFLPRRG
jgi:membrane-bound metal-dependent hydrolase YbcI (DUF457 family)